MHGIMHLRYALTLSQKKPWFLDVCSTSLLQTLWEKEKLRVTSVDLFILFKHRINPFPNKPWFLGVCSTSLLKTLWEKENLLVTSNFSFSRSVFYPFGEVYIIFIKLKIVVCKLFQLERV